MVDEKGIPLIISDIVDHLMRTDCCIEGLFRISGNRNDETNIINSYKNQKKLNNLDFKNYDELTLANVIKTALREYSNPLFTFEFYSNFLETTEITDKTERLEKVSQHLNQLPTANLETFFLLFQLLAKVEENSSVNKMTCENLGKAQTIFQRSKTVFLDTVFIFLKKLKGTCFGPCLLRSPETLEPSEVLTLTQKAIQVVAHLIENFDSLKV